MKHFVMGLLAGILLLTACSQVSSESQISITEEMTSTSSPFSTSTVTPIPTETPTASITPLSTIPTFTPTFDVSTIATVTPAPKAECPSINAAITPEIYFPEKLEYPSANSGQLVLTYLNQGGRAEALVKRLDRIYPVNEFRGGYAFRDLTGDLTNEFLYVDLYYNGKPIVFSCKNGKYSVLAILSGEHNHDFYKIGIEELIPDGVPEIIVEGTSGVSVAVSTFYIYKWDGKTFLLLGQVTFAATRQVEIKDVHGDGIKEILLIGDNPVCVSCRNYIPQRQRTVVYGWNGKEFVEISSKFESPEYRFQAIQDADAAVIVGNYDKAIQLYQETTLNDKLEWWSLERYRYEQHIGDPVLMFIETPSIIPDEDFTEYPSLAAYAYYRIMLLHIVQGHESDAGTVYKTLQQKFGNDPYGQPYVQMATEFWNAYQSTHKMYDGCAAAIQYAAGHPEILVPLGSDYHGWQSHTYVPADVCPFR